MLTHCPDIVAVGMADTGICHSLSAVQMDGAGVIKLFNAEALRICEVVELLALRLGYMNVNAAHEVDYLPQLVQVYGDIVGYIKPEILIEGLYGKLRAAALACGVLTVLGVLPRFWVALRDYGLGCPTMIATDSPIAANTTLNKLLIVFAMFIAAITVSPRTE